MAISSRSSPPVAAREGRSARSANRPASITGPSRSSVQPWHSTFTIGGTQIRLPLPGPGNVENALAAWAVCDQFGLSRSTPSPRRSRPCSAVSMRAETLQIGSLDGPQRLLQRQPGLHEERPGHAAQPSCRRRREPRPPAGLHLRRNGRAWVRRRRPCTPNLGQAVAEAGVDLLVTVGDAAADHGPSRPKETARRNLQTDSFDDTLSVCNHLQEFVRAGRYNTGQRFADGPVGAGGGAN